VKDKNLSAVRSVLQKFQDGYTARDLTRLDEFMQWFVQSDDIEMIGTGASKRGANEWCEGLGRVREIIESDWKYWGDVRLDVEGAKITLHGDVAWLSTTGTVTTTIAFDTVIQFHLNDMKAIFDEEGLSADEKLMEVTHYGMRRLRDRSKGLGYSRPFRFTAVLVKDGPEWRFHASHWAMRVD
jgi:SnoaL-like domain